VALKPKQKREQVSVYVDEPDLRRVDAIAERTGASRNEVVREALKKGLPIVEAENLISASGKP
jgi:metal-responsive CopG/Arc/MetJ family transcriptional regulator